MSDRLLKSLTQRAREKGHVRSVEEAARLAETLARMCGPRSQSRQATFRIGCVLLARECPTVLVPVCPDYGHEGGRYTFRHLGSGVPLSVKLHAAFLQQMQLAVPCKPHLLIADREEEDEVICRAVGIDRCEFGRRVEGSLAEIVAMAGPRGWAASRMSDVIRDLTEREASHADYIRNDGALSARVKSDAVARWHMYRRIDTRLTSADMEARTARTMAQYRAVGSFVVSNECLVVNHTTTNLSAYADVGAALIHNPVEVY